MLPETGDCGGDCLQCMTDFDDPDCIELMKKLNDPALRDQEILRYEAWRIKQTLKD